MVIKDLIQGLAEEMRDPNMIVTSNMDWLSIINREGAELFPEITIKKTITVAFSSINSTTLELDMSSYTGIRDVEKVDAVDSDGKSYYFDNWIYDENRKILLLNPDSNIDPTLILSSSYPNIKITYKCSWVDVNGLSVVDLETEHQGLFRKICIKAAINGVLYDHTKLDRYRTLVGRANEFTLLAIIRDLTAEIELKKSKLTNKNIIRTF
jgi:hypothetical protein